MLGKETTVEVIRCHSITKENILTLKNSLLFDRKCCDIVNNTLQIDALQQYTNI